MTRPLIYVIDLTKDTADLPEVVVPAKDAKVEAQPCGSDEWIPLAGERITLYLNLAPCHMTENCPHYAYSVDAKERREVVFPKSGKKKMVTAIAFETHLIRITGNYEIRKQDPWCRECQTWHPEGRHRAKTVTSLP